MTIDPNCWVELSGVSPAAQTRGPRVTTAPGNVPNDGKPPIEGDIHVDTVTGSSYVYDGDTGHWYALGSPPEQTYWGNGYMISTEWREKSGPKPPVHGEALIAVNDNTGQVELKIYDAEKHTWVDPTRPIKPGDDYTDMLTGRVYEIG